MKTAIAAAAAVSLTACSLFAEGKQPAPGDLAPSFSLPSSNGKRVSLADYQGRTVVLAFFVKAFTGG